MNIATIKGERANYALHKHLNILLTATHSHDIYNLEMTGKTVNEHSRDINNPFIIEDRLHN